ncbi:MAG TPA: prephenate dehydrogenase/arogenate dehydrogenase family protein [Polyangiaceae bacterium]
MFGEVTVVGCGLIGGSIVRSLRARGGASRLYVVDERRVIDAARPYVDDGAIPGSPEASEWVARSELIVLAVPVGAIMKSLTWVLDTMGAAAVVTDTGSVKKPVVAAAAQHPRGARFIGGHPMAGREVGGFESATRELFEGAQWFLVPNTNAGGPKAAPSNTNAGRAAPGKGSNPLDRAAALARAVGAAPVLIDADAHDRAMAYVSHAPQLLASALYAVAARAGVLGEAGSGFRDMTRIAGGPSSIWRDIFEANREPIAEALGQILEPLAELKDRLARGDEEAIAAGVELLERAHAARCAAPPGRDSKGESDS